jgi:hypothetical protein
MKPKRKKGIKVAVNIKKNQKEMIRKKSMKDMKI